MNGHVFVNPRRVDKTVIHHVLPQKKMMKRRMIQVVTMMVDSLLGFVIIAFVPFSWILRDGLGPNAVESFGVHALYRCFTTFYTGPILIVLTMLAITCHWIKRKQEKMTAEHANPN